MVHAISKKRGRPRKLIVKLSDVQDSWEKRLRRMKLGTVPLSEIGEDDIPFRQRDAYGRKIRPTKVIYAEEISHRSITQETDAALSALREVAVNEQILLPETWKRYLDYMNVIAEFRSPQDRGAHLKSLFLEDARTHIEELPPRFPEEIGTPEDFKRRLSGHELELRFGSAKRTSTIRVRVYSLPPDVDENLDPIDEPEGCWEGLRWTPARPKPF